MAALALAGMLGRGWDDPARIGTIVLLFFAGALPALPASGFVARWLTGRRAPETRFAAHFLGLAAATVGFTAAIYAIFYRAYFAEWHEPAFTIVWFFQFVFTVLGALYQFAVLGLPLYAPWGVAALAVFALSQTRTVR